MLIYPHLVIINAIYINRYSSEVYVYISWLVQMCIYMYSDSYRSTGAQLLCHSTTGHSHSNRVIVAPCITRGNREHDRHTLCAIFVS